MGQDEQQKLERLQVPEIGELIDGRYRVQGVIATGGMGVILRAEQLPMERPVAIKLLHPHIAAADPNIVERFEREVRLAKLLNHPNTIRLYDFGESERGLVYVAMELLEGMDLKRLIAREGVLTAGRALQICRQMLDGLAEAHDHDFIHRDLKPSNVFIVKSRRGEDIVKLLDFGIAKSLSDAADLTGSGSICGTPSYVAPEYLMQEHAGKPSDVYAVGLILIEMLTGRRVFKGEAPVQTMMMHLKLDPELPEEVENTALAEVLRKATAKEPAQRYQDAEQMYEAICEAAEKVPDDLVVSRPDLQALPDVSAEVELEPTAEDEQRARVDTIVPEVHDAARIEKSAPAIGSRSRRGVGVKMLAAAGGVVLVAAAAVLWLLDPGRAPELAMSADDGRPSDEVVSASGDGQDTSLVAVGSHLGAPSKDTSQRQNEKEKKAPVIWDFEIDTDPSGALVTIEGQEIGRTPLTYGFTPDKLPQTVHFEFEGYEPHEVELTRHSSPIVVEVLEEKVEERPRSVAKRDERAGETAKSQAESPEELTEQRIKEVMDRYLVE